MTTLEDRCVGCMIGLAVGDAMGYPVEFLNRLEIKERFGEAGITGFVADRFFKLGQYSDDTQMSIAVAKALLLANTSNLDDVMLHIKREFILWANSDDNNRAPGQTCMDGIRNMETGIHWFASGDPYSKGCGAAMRVAPIGLRYFNNEQKLVEVARAVSICTHGHPTGISSAIVAAAAIAYVVNEGLLDGMLSHLIGVLTKKRGIPEFKQEIVTYDPLGEQTQLLSRLEQVLTHDPESAFDQIGGGWIGEEAVAGALYCFLRSPSDFRQTILVAANASMTDVTAKGKGRCDSDSIACIAGGISGAFNGIQGIPQSWIEDIENKSVLWQLGQELARQLEQSA